LHKKDKGGKEMKGVSDNIINSSYPINEIDNKIKLEKISLEVFGINYFSVNISPFQKAICRKRALGN
jgi:hypothetical protein